MRKLFVFGCAALLAAGLSTVAFAGSLNELDSDGVPNNLDNCQSINNGPLANVSSCASQFDVDQDGYGNACDPDLSNNNVVDFPDIGVVLGSLGGSNPAADITCNGVVDFPDLGAILGSLGQAMAGRSGLACAGTIPCTN